MRGSSIAVASSDGDGVGVATGVGSCGTGSGAAGGGASGHDGVKTLCGRPWRGAGSTALPAMDNTGAAAGVSRDVGGVATSAREVVCLRGIRVTWSPGGKLVDR